MSTAITSTQVQTYPRRRLAMLIALVAVAATALTLAIVAATGGFTGTSNPAPVRVLPATATATPQYIGGHGERRPVAEPPANDGSQHPGQRP